MMLRALRMLSAAIAGITIAGCSPPGTVESAALGAPPVAAAATHIGPIPGPRMNQSAIALENPFEDDARARVDGRQLFVRFNCSGCHGGHAGGGMGPSLRDTTWIYGNSPANVFSSIAQGRAHGMPAWGSLLPEEQIWKLVSYVRTLGTDDESMPPSPAPAAASPSVAQQVD